MKNSRQVAGFYITPETLHQPEKSEPYIRKMAEDGYGVAALFWRYFNLNLYSGEQIVHDCIARTVELVHSHGMRCMLDTDVAWWGKTLCERHPECAQIHYVSSRERVWNNSFHFVSKRPAIQLLSQRQSQMIFDSLEVCVPENGTFRRLRPDELAFDWQTVLPGYEIQGKLHFDYSGELFFFVGSRCYGLPDPAHGEFLKAQRRILDFLADIPLDGFGWDEPGKGGSDLNVIKSGDGFAALFRKLRGYDLLDKLPYLLELDDTAEAIKVRLDYFDTLTEMNYQAQKQHNDYAGKLARRKLLFGTHQTWSGLPADLAAGVMDYFKLGKVLSAAWTDGSWDTDLRQYAFHLMLADSLREELGVADACYNDWGSITPAVEDMHFATRFKMLFHVNWFNSWFSDFTDLIVNYRLEPLHSESAKDVAALERVDKFLGGMHADTPIALLYEAKSFAAAPKWLIRCHYTGIGNAAQMLLDSGQSGSFVTPEALSGTVLKDGILFCGQRRFQVLVLPNCYILDKAVWEKVKSLAQAGFPVVAVGVPPMWTSSGESIREEFAGLVGMAPFSLADLEAAYRRYAPLPRPEEWELEYYDAIFPVSVTTGRPVPDAENRTIALFSGSCGLIFMPEIDPRENLPSILRKLVVRREEIYADHTYYRWYSLPSEPDERILILAAHGRTADTCLLSCRHVGGNAGLARRRHRQQRVLVQTAAGTLSVRDGTWCAVRFRAGRFIEWIGDAETVEWQEKKKPAQEALC